MRDKTNEGNGDMSRHTWDSWKVGGKDDQGRLVYSSDGQLVAKIYHGGCVWRQEEMERNALLVAAAPDLLDALVELVKKVEAVQNGEGNIGVLALQPARSAIARAGRGGKDRG